MNTDFLSGLLLTAVVLFGIGYVVKTLFGESIAAFFAEQRAEPPRGANTHLIGAVGKVVDDGTRSGELRVRVGMERWSARLLSPEGGKLPIGAEVEVKAVEGRVLEVAEKPAA